MNQTRIIFFLKMVIIILLLLFLKDGKIDGISESLQQEFLF